MKKKFFIGLLMVIVIWAGVSIAQHYYYKHQAEISLDKYIALYHFPSGKVTVGKVYEQLKMAYRYTKIVSIKGDKENYYIFYYNWKSKTVDLSGVLYGGDEVDVSEAPFKKMKYQPSRKFMAKYNAQAQKSE